MRRTMHESACRGTRCCVRWRDKMLNSLLAAVPPGTPPEMVEAALARMPREQRIASYLSMARDSMAAYVAYLDLGFLPAAHHLLLISELQRVERGEGDRLMVCMPPGSAKTTYTSVMLPAWYLGRHPTNNVIAVSHTHDLASAFGRRVRNLYASPEHVAVFGVGIAPDSQAADDIQTGSSHHPRLHGREPDVTQTARRQFPVDLDR